MAISLRATGSASSGTTSCTPSLPSGVVAGDLSIMTVSAKPYNTTIPTPSGWISLGTHTNGTVASGGDTGSTVVSVFYRFGASTTTPSVSGTGANCIGAQITSYTKNSTESWITPTFTTGGDASHGVDFSATGAANLLLATGDWLFAGVSINTDNGPPDTFNLSAASSTISGETARTNQGYASGEDGRIITVDSPVTGTSSAAPQLTFTNIWPNSGTVIFVRLRTGTPTITATFNDSVNSPGYDILLANINTGATTLSVYRIDVSGVYPEAVVRGMDGAALSTLAASDYEAPFVSEIKYRLEMVDASGVIATSIETSPITVEYVLDNPPTYVELYTSNFYIKDPLQPQRSLALIVSDMRTVNVPGNILGKEHVLGRDKPVVVTDSMGGRTGEMTILCADIFPYGRTPRNSIKILLDSGEVLMFQCVRRSSDVRDMYFIVDDYAETIGGVVTTGSDLIFEFNVSFTEVERPSTSGSPTNIASWQNLLDDPAFPSFDDVASSQNNWLDILRRYSS